MSDEAAWTTADLHTIDGLHAALSEATRALLQKDMRIAELEAELSYARPVAEAVAALTTGRGTIAAVRAAGDAYRAWKARSE